MTLSDEIIRTTHLPQLGGVYFDVKNQYKILLNTVKKNFFLEFIMPIKTYERLKRLYYILLSKFSKKWFLRNFILFL